MQISMRAETAHPDTDLLHQSFQLVTVLPQATLHPVENLGVELAIAGQGQVVF